MEKTPDKRLKKYKFHLEKEHKSETPDLTCRVCQKFIRQLKRDLPKS